MSAQYEHGGSFWKNLWLLLRSLLNLIAFAALWYGLISGVTILIPLWIWGAILCAIALTVNFILPIAALSPGKEKVPRPTDAAKH